MDKNDIFKSIRENFFEYWREKFEDNDIADVRSLLAQQESGSQDHQSEDSNLDDQNRTAISPLEIKDMLILIHQIDDSSQLPVIKTKLSRLSEKLQVNKLKASPDDQNSGNVWKFVRLLTHDMFNIKFRNNSTFKVQWYAQLCLQTKLIASENTKSYRKLLRSFQENWEIFVKGSTNAEKQDIMKLVAFVSHIDSRESERENDFIRASVDAEKAERLYKKVGNWEFDDIKRHVLADITESLSRYAREQRAEGKIGPAGGVLSLNECRLEIPAGALNSVTNMRIRSSIENPNINDDVVAISPVMQCEGDNEISEIETTIKLPEYCETENDYATASLYAKKTKYSDWIKKGEKLLKGVKGGIRFTARFAHKFVITMEKKLIKDAIYWLKTEVWHSNTGNFLAVCYVDTKAVSTEWERKMREDGYCRCEARINGISVSGTDELSVQLKAITSRMIRFDPEISNKFSVEKNIAPHDQGYTACFHMNILPLGNERLFLQSTMRNGENAETTQWALQWPDLSGGDIKYTFRHEILPSFKALGRLDAANWQKFVENVLLIKSAYQKPPLPIKDEEMLTKHRMDTLCNWLQNEKGSGKKKLDNKQVKKLQDLLRTKTKQYRERE